MLDVVFFSEITFNDDNYVLSCLNPLIYKMEELAHIGRVDNVIFSVERSIKLTSNPFCSITYG